MFNYDEEIIFESWQQKTLKFTDMQDMTIALRSVNFNPYEFSMINKNISLKFPLRLISIVFPSKFRITSLQWQW